MPQLVIEIPFQISQEESRTRLLRRIEEAKLDSRIGKVSDVKENWETPNKLTFSFKVYGFAVNGVMEVLPRSLKIDFTLPFAAMMVKGMIESQLKSELTQLLT